MSLFNFNRTENPNAVAAVFLLVLLAVFAGPNVLPRLIASIPFVDEGVACQNLRLGDERDIHQSLIGRAASSRPEAPIDLAISSNAVGSTEGQLIVEIVISNRTLGTIPILITRDNVLVNQGNGQSGLGVSFDGNIVGAATGNAASNVRLLGPRQVCVHRVAFPVNQLPAGFLTGAGTLTAYYRNNSPGAVVQSSLRAPVYTDLGLWVGLTQSQPFVVPIASQ